MRQWDELFMETQSQKKIKLKNGTKEILVIKCL